jgi:biopolymer transport protein ExbB
MTKLLTSSTARRRIFTLARWVGMFTIACILLLVSARVLGQTPPGSTTTPTTPAATAPAVTGAAPAAAGGKTSLITLFLDSWDLFTVLLVGGSLAAWTIIIICLIEVRKSKIAPEEPTRIIDQLCRAEPPRWSDLRQFVNEDEALVCKIVRAAVNMPTSDKNAMREAAELAASEESAKWFRRLEPLNVIGNMGPLLGLAGTVWGMIIAFAALGAAGGQANPAVLSLGISKALFHTLLGLMLAVPCLLVFGFFRQIVDKHCTRVMVQASDLVELLPADARIRLGGAPSGGNGSPRAPMPQPMPRPVATPR